MEFMNAMLPMAVFLGVGYMLRKTGVAEDKVKNFLSKYLFYFAMPSLAFRSIASFDFKEAFVPELILHNLSVTLIAFLIMMGIVFFIRDKDKRGAAHMAVYRSNQGYIGMYAVRSMYGQLALSKAAVVNGFDNPFVNLLAVAGMEILQSKTSGKTFLRGVGKVFANVIKNPFVIAVVLGMIEAALKTGVLKFAALDKSLEMAGNTALPLALVLVGVSITFTYLKTNFKLVMILSVAKLVFVPLAAYISGVYIFGLNTVDLNISVIMLATPVAVSSYVFAREMGADEELMASCIGLSTLLSIFTLPIVNSILNL